MVALVRDDLLDALGELILGRLRAFLPHLLEVGVGGGQRLPDRLRVAGSSAMQRHADDRTRLEVDRLLVLVREVSSPALHLHDLRLGVLGVHPLLVRPLLRPLAVEPRQILARRLFDPLGLRQLDQKLPVTASIVASNDRPQRRVRLQRRRVDPQRLAMQQVLLDMLFGGPAPAGNTPAPAGATTPPDSTPERSSVREHERRSPGRRPLPEHLPRVEIEVVPPEVQREGLSPGVYRWSKTVAASATFPRRAAAHWSR